MIHVFKYSFDVLVKNKHKNNYILSSILFVFFSYLYLNSDFGKNEILKKTSENLFTFSGIFSAVLITFIISKIFQIRNEKRELKLKIIVLCNKVTDFRRICEKIINNYDVWDLKTKSKLDNKYKYLTYQHLYDDYQKDKPKKLISDFNSETELRGSYFYLALRNLVNVKRTSFYTELYSDHDHDIIYPLETIDIWSGTLCANAFFYYLDHKYHSYKSDILIDNLTNEERKEILNLAKKINKDKYHDKAFGRRLLIDIGNDFEGDIFIKLRNLLYTYNENFPTTFKYTLKILYIVIFFGIFIPLIFPFLNIFPFLQNITIFISISTILIAFVNFLLDFSNILKKEINI